MKKLLLLLLIIGIEQINGQIITTFAGTGTAGFSNGSPANTAQLNWPFEVAIAPNGNIYISDASNNLIRMVDPTGTNISTVVGYTITPGYSGNGGPATAAMLTNPAAIEFDAAGNLYIADGNSCIRKVDLSNTITIIAGQGNGSHGYGGDLGPATAAFLYEPTDIAFDANGDMFIADAANHIIRKIDHTTGNISTYAGTPNSAAYSGDNGAATSAQLNWPTAIAFDASNNLYIADRQNYVIRKVTPGGIITTYAGSNAGGCAFGGYGGPVALTKFCNPSGLTFDAAGNLYIADEGNSIIVKINTSGVSSIIAGADVGGVLNGYTGDNGPAQNAQLNSPNRIVFDATGNYFIPDQANQAIRKVCVKTDSVTGFVFDTLGNPVTSGKVYAFKRQARHNGYIDTLGYSPIAANGYYGFSSVIGNNYLIKAIADTTIYHTSIPTYYSTRPKSYQWDSASIINNNPCSISNSTGNNITIIEIPNLTGPGTISGSVSSIAGYGQRWGSGATVLGAPLKGVDVKLGKNPGGSPAARTTTGSGGTYTFSNVPIGSYKIYVDIPNYGMDSVRAINITSLNTTSSNNNYFVDSVLIHVDSTSGATNVNPLPVNENHLLIYPNPSNNYITLKSLIELGTISIYNSLGEIVLQKRSKNATEQIDVSKLSSGIYTIMVQGRYKRLIKE
jgi:streptogramin lyase